MSSELTDFKNLNVQNILFSETYNGKYSKFIPIGYSANNEDEEIQKLILNTPPNLYTNGIRERKDQKTGAVIGYHMSLNMWNKRKGATEEEKQFTEKLNQIVDYIKQFLSSIKEELNIDQKLIDNLRILSFFSSDDEKVDPPKLFCKLMLNNKSKKIITQFIDEENDKYLDPETLIQKNGLVTTALKFENISITENRINIEIRVFEVLYKEIKHNNRKSLLKPNMVDNGWKSTGKRSKTVDDDPRKKAFSAPKNDSVSKNTFAALQIDDEDQPAPENNINLKNSPKTIQSEQPV